MVYNLLATFVVSVQLGCIPEVFQEALDAFSPQNGRLQSYKVYGHQVLSNLAKNPTGFNQNIEIIKAAGDYKVAAFFVNDMEGDGRDVSWLWDVRFDDLLACEHIHCFVGGRRKNDLQVRFKYAGIQAELVDSAREVMEKVRAWGLDESYDVYMIANYTSLPQVRADLLALEALEGSEAVVTEAEETEERVPTAETPTVNDNEVSRETIETLLTPKMCPIERMHRPLRIVHLYPDLLNLNGDGGNVTVLQKRLEWRGIPCEVTRVLQGDAINLNGADIVFMAGGADKEQRFASELLNKAKEQLSEYVRNGGILLAIGGGYQLLGDEWLLAEEAMEGLGLVPMHTVHADYNRLVGNIAVSVPSVKLPVVGYENHAGRTNIHAGAESFGKVINSEGHGNNDSDKQDGVVYKNVIGSYIHGPLLAKNPDVADVLLKRALKRLTGHAVVLPALDDTEEIAANHYCAREMKLEI